MPITHIPRKSSANLSLDPEVLAAVDAQRRHIPRSTFVNDVLWQLFVASDEQLERLSTYGSN
jgi:hypothetical protein